MCLPHRCRVVQLSEAMLGGHDGGMTTAGMGKSLLLIAVSLRKIKHCRAAHVGGRSGLQFLFCCALHLVGKSTTITANNNERRPRLHFAMAC